jgi:hypothetical protein
MNLLQFTAFLNESKRLKLEYDWVVIIGGEPTLHPNCVDFIRLARDYGHNVVLFSNGKSDRAKAIIYYVETENLCYVDHTTFKNNSVNHAVQDTDYSVFISPDDVGKIRTEECGSYKHCGFSVDSLGYTACSLGGMISSFLCPQVRTKRLGDLVDYNFVQQQLLELCKHCGTLLCTRADLKESYIYRGTVMSKTWYNAFQGGK